MGIATFTPLPHPRCTGLCQQGRSACTCATGATQQQHRRPPPFGNTVPLPHIWDTAECRAQVEQWLDDQAANSATRTDADVDRIWRTLDGARAPIALWVLVLLNIGIWAAVVVGAVRWMK